MTETHYVSPKEKYVSLQMTDGNEICFSIHNKYQL